MNPSRQLVQARLMVTFARVVESGSISMAATLLSLDKAGISRQISELEAMLGVKLLNRSTRGLCLTDVGSAVYERAARVVAELESTHAEAEHARAIPSGVLSISASVAFGVAHLVPYLGAFSKKHPEIKLDLCLLDRHVDPFEEGIDVLLRICDAPPDNMVASRLTDIHYVLVAAPTFLACTKPLTSPRDLAGVHCLFYGFRKHTSVWRFASGEGTVEVPVTTDISVNNSDAVKSLAVQGLGVALLPRFAVAEDIASGALVEVLPLHVPQGYLGTGLYALHPPSRHPAPKLRAFLDFIKGAWLLDQTWHRPAVVVATPSPAA